jgi:hypothetical protein
MTNIQLLKITTKFEIVYNNVTKTYKILDKSTFKRTVLASGIEEDELEQWLILNCENSLSDIE